MLKDFESLDKFCIMTSFDRSLVLGEISNRFEQDLRLRLKVLKVLILNLDQ